MARLSKADQKALTVMLEGIKNDFIATQAAKGIRAGGRSADSLQVVQTGKGPVLKGVKYWKYLMEGTGRGPGKEPPHVLIEDWILDKGLSVEGTIEQAAKRISKSIGEKGTGIHRGKPGIPLKEIVTGNLNTGLGFMVRRKVQDILKPFRK